MEAFLAENLRKPFGRPTRRSSAAICVPGANA